MHYASRSGEPRKTSTRVGAQGGRCCSARGSSRRRRDTRRRGCIISPGGSISSGSRISPGRCTTMSRRDASRKVATPRICGGKRRIISRACTERPARTRWPDACSENTPSCDERRRCFGRRGKIYACVISLKSTVVYLIRRAGSGLFVRRFAFGSDVHASRRRPRGAGDAGLHATGDARNDAVFLLSSPSSISSSHSRDEGLLPAAFVPSTSSSSSGAHVDARESTESRLAIRPLAANTSPGRRAASVSPSRSRCSPRSRADTGKLDPNVSTWSSKDRPARSGGRLHASSSSAELGAGLKGGVNGNEGEVVGWVARSGKGGVLAVMHVPKVSMCPSRRRATSSGSGDAFRTDGATRGTRSVSRFGDGGRANESRRRTRA